MESETLFNEEAEPPGKSAGLVASGRSFRAMTKKNPSFPVLVGREESPSEPGGDETAAFRSAYFPNIKDSQWNDWRWQLNNRISNAAFLSRYLGLTDREREALDSRGILPLAITPYYLSLIVGKGADHPLRRTVVPGVEECLRSLREEADPLREEEDSPVPGIVHRYPDRVLFLVTGQCATYCRYCTRSRLVGHRGEDSSDKWDAALSYIAADRTIRDVLISGGDPLTLSDEKLNSLLTKLRLIPHVEIIRIGTKVPAVLPQRITPDLLGVLRRHHPLWMSIHATHPDELTPEMSKACNALADAGIPLGSQTVLLAGINDEAETMKRLFQELLRLRVKPYYLYQCDPIPGSAHFRTAVGKGIEIIRALRGHTTGYAVPTFVIDAPGGGGKIPLSPEYVVGGDGVDLLLKNYEGNLYRYPDTQGSGLSPCLDKGTYDGLNL